MLRFIFRLFLTALVAAIVSVGGLATAKRMKTGTWSLPNRDDVAWLRHAIERDDSPPRIIYLNRDALTVRGGFDDADGNRTQLIESGKESTIPGFSGSKRKWSQIVSCVRTKFKPFNVEITDERPSSGNFIMVHVGGQPRDLYGEKRIGMGGVAPFNGDVISGAIVFAFSKSLQNKLDSVCHTIAHEIGHVYGLDHTYRCHDVMTYLQGCGKKRFVDAVVRCGEHKRRDCDHGNATQNSYDHLYNILGPREPADSPKVAARTAK